MGGGDGGGRVGQWRCWLAVWRHDNIRLAALQENRGLAWVEEWEKKKMEEGGR